MFTHLGSKHPLWLPIERELAATLFIAADASTCAEPIIRILAPQNESRYYSREEAYCQGKADPTRVQSSGVQQALRETLPVPQEEGTPALATPELLLTRKPAGNQHTFAEEVAKPSMFDIN